MRYSTCLRTVLAAWISTGLYAAQASAQATAETKMAAARQLGQAGVELFMKGDNSAALDKLQRAYSVYQAPTLGLWYGRALERAGRLVEASERYRQVAGAELSTDATSAFRQAKVDAKTALDAVTPHLAQLTIDVPALDLASLQVRLDGSELPASLLGIAIPVNPGSHTLHATLGTQSLDQTLQLKEGEPLSTSLAFPPEPIAPAAPAGYRSSLQPAAYRKPTETPLPREQILKVLQGLHPDIDNCTHGHASGAVASLIIRGATGRVENARVKLDERFVQQLGGGARPRAEQLVDYYSNCMVQVLEKAQFPLFQKPFLEIQYPFRSATTAPTAARAR